MKIVSPRGSDVIICSERPDSPYLVLKGPSPPALGGTVNLILSFSNSGDTQLQVQTPGGEEGVTEPEPVHRVRITTQINHLNKILTKTGTFLSGFLIFHMTFLFSFVINTWTLLWMDSFLLSFPLSFLDYMFLSYFSYRLLQPAESHSSARKSLWKRCQGLFGSLKRKKKFNGHSAEEVNIVMLAGPAWANRNVFLCSCMSFAVF